MRHFLSFSSFFFTIFIIFFSNNLEYIECKETANDRLNQHGVPQSIRKAIQGMTSSGLKKDAIRQNIQGHFPDKQAHEINDIIVLSNAEGGIPQPRQKDNKKETNRKIKNAQVKFDQWKNRRA